MLGIAFGTRPEFIKLKPVMDALHGQKPFRVIFTGQHKDLVNNIPNELDLVEITINDGRNRRTNWNNRYTKEEWDAWNKRKE